MKIVILGAGQVGANLAASSRGDVDAAFSGAKVVEAIYEAPHASHAQMEPLNATARFDGDKLEVWLGTQIPMNALRLAAAVFTPLATLFLRVFCDTACAWTATPLFDVGWQDSSRHKRAWLGPAQECAQNSTFPAKINDLCEFVTSSRRFRGRIIEQG